MDCLCAGLWLQPPVFTYTCCFHHVPITTGLEGVHRQIGNWWWVAKLTCVWKFYSEKTGAQGQSHSLGLGSGTKNCYDGRLPGCSGWPGLLWVPHPALGTPTRLATTTFTTVDLQVNSSACSAGSQASHAVGLIQPNPNSPRVWDPSATLTWFSKLAKASTQGVATVACDNYRESQVRAECQWRSSGRQAVLKKKKKKKRTWWTLLPKVLTTPWTPHTPWYSKQKGRVSTLSDKPLKLVDQFAYLSSNITSTESDINIPLLKV